MTIACESMFAFCFLSWDDFLTERRSQPTLRIKVPTVLLPTSIRKVIGLSVFRCCTLHTSRYSHSCVGVLTKPDRIPAGEEAIWISKIQRGGKDGIEYFSVKNPDSQEIRDGVTYEQAREKETAFFSTSEPWSNLEWLYRRRLGTDKLTTRLGQLLSSLISKRQVLSPLILALI